MAILVIITAATVNVMGAFYSTSLVDNEARALYSYVRYARQQAAGNDSSSDYSVHFETITYTGFLGDTYSAVNPDNDVQDTTTQVTITSSFTDDTLTFENLTGRAAEAGSVTLTGPSGIAKVITVNELGIITY